MNDIKEGALLETKLSSLVWICTSTHAAGIVTVIDANNPAEILNSFGVCANHLLCIASVPGASPDDYESDNDPTFAENITKEPNSDPSETEKDTDTKNTSEQSTGGNGEESKSDANQTSDVSYISYQLINFD